MKNFLNFECLFDNAKGFYDTFSNFEGPFVKNAKVVIGRINSQTLGSRKYFPLK